MHQVDPTTLTAGCRLVGGAVELLTMNLPGCGKVVPLWESRQQMMRTIRSFSPRRIADGVMFASIKNGEQFLALARRHGLYVVLDLEIDPRLGTITFYRLAWN